MLAAVDEVKAYGLGIAGSRGSVDHDGLVGGGDARVAGLGEVGEEDVVPEGCTGGGTNVLDVEDVVLEVLVEDAGLDLEGGLGGFERVLQREESGGGVGSKVEGVDEAQTESKGGDDGDDADEIECTHAGCAHCGDLGVCSEAGQTKKDADQHGHGDGYGERVGQGVEEDAGGVGDGG